MEGQAEGLLGASALADNERKRNPGTPVGESARPKKLTQR